MKTQGKIAISVMLIVSALYVAVGINSMMAEIDFRDSCREVSGILEYGKRDSSGSMPGGKMMYCKNYDGEIIKKEYFGS